MPPILADGAMGTELLARSGLAGVAPAALNLSERDLVRMLHVEYIQAGARLLIANTLGATPEQAQAGVRLAREAVAGTQNAAPMGTDSSLDAQNDKHADGILIAGSLLADPPPERELIQALAGADFLILETVTSLSAVEANIHAIRRVTAQPVWCTFSFDVDGKLDGLAPAEVARKAEGLDLASFGYGCGFGLDASRPVMTAMRQAAPDAVLIAKPNLGLPRNGRYDPTPTQTVEWAAEMVELGIQVVGLCCGSTPTHIRAIARRLGPGC